MTNLARQTRLEDSLPPLNAAAGVPAFERRLWILDQRINDRGFKIDTKLARAAIKAYQGAKRDLDAQVSRITEGVITSGTQRERIQKWLNEHGIHARNLRAKTVEGLLARQELSADVRQVLEVRQEGSKSSVAKYRTALQALNTDGRIRGGLQFCGANRTGRWAGRLLQPHNFPRPKRKGPAIELAVKALHAGATELVEDNMLSLCSDTLRSLIIAEKNHRLLVADYNAIEGRYLAWLAGEAWKLQAYENDEDLYIRTFCQLFGIPYNDNLPDDLRQQGKVFELSMGYEGGVKALLTTAQSYAVDIPKLAQAAWLVADAAIRVKAKKLYELAKRETRTLGLSQKLYTQLEAAKLLWRRAAPKTVALWKQYNNAARLAIRNPGNKYAAGRCHFIMKSDTLVIRMPSGRFLMYMKPRIHKDDSITYATPYGGRDYMYGGKIAENVTQAGARDVMAHAMLQLDTVGYPIILTVHDEIICETAANDASYNIDHMCGIMNARPPWAPGLPLKAKGYEATRYRKD